MKQDVIAVLDVGKTNKKVLIFDMALKVLAKQSKVFDEIPYSGSIKVEQPEAVYFWFVDVLKEFAGTYNIKAISVTTHGAFGVCVDDEGTTCPPLAYTNAPEGDFSDSFFDAYGDRGELQRKTATAEIGDMVNFAKIVHYWQLNNPDKLAQTKHILMYPQYFGYRLTCNAGAEPTMMGCHTYLYNHTENSYSDIAEAMGIIDKLPKDICNSWEVLGTVTPDLIEQIGLADDCIVTYGVHDSNSSLLPFLITEKQDFVLNSTGTWCVMMKQAQKVEFAEDEIGKTVFYNQDVFKCPVKTSVFMGGLEYETYMKLLSGIHGRDDLPEFDQELYNRVLTDGNCYILPSVVKGAGLFPNSQARVVDKGSVVPYEIYSNDPSAVSFFADYEYAVAVLICSLAIQTGLALGACGFNSGDDILVEGGFRKNRPYLELLSVINPSSKVYTTNIEEATALGAAILGAAALNSVTPDKLEVPLDIDKLAIDMPVNELESFSSYRQGFLDLVKMEGCK